MRAMIIVLGAAALVVGCGAEGQTLRIASRGFQLLSC